LYSVDNLKPIKYFNKKSGKEDIGFIAHEVQENFPCLVTGEKDGEEFAKGYNNTFLNKIGKTSLPELIELLAKARFIICVDTGALHIAAAVECPVVGLFSGKFYKRFAPYPKESAPNFYPIYPDFVDELIKKNDPILYDVSVMKNNTMKLIPPEKVKPYINLIMNK
jgi:ADP-heptose:LPS heptosyltransferase